MSQIDKVEMQESTLAGGRLFCRSVQCTDLLVALSLVWLCKDWLTSLVEPYPYGFVLFLTTAAMLAYVGYSWNAARRFIRLVGLLQVASAVWLACAFGMFAVGTFLTTSGALLSVRVLSHNGGRAARLAVAAALMTAIILLARANVLAVRPSGASEPWLGDGVTITNGTVSIGRSAIECAIGVPGLAFLVAGALAAVWLGASVALNAYAPNDRRIVALLGLCGVLTILVIIGNAGTYPLRDIFSAYCTGLVSVVGIRAAVANPPPAPTRSTIWSRRDRAIAAITATTVVGAILWAAAGSVDRLLSPYAAGGWGKVPGRVKTEEISQPMQDATIAMEDAYFYRHRGFDWLAIHRAIRVDIRHGRIEQGGSTITQQLAKNLFLSNDRTLLRKAEEAVIAWRLERMLTKRQILELYLNTIDYGMGQRGVGAASSYYFHKKPSDLSPVESAILVGMVPNPMHGDLDSDHILRGEQTALTRLGYFFPDRYREAEIGRARLVPLDRVMYPYKDAWDRGATQVIPAQWHGVDLYYAENPHAPEPIDHVAQCLKSRLAGFLDTARIRYRVMGIDHVGVYDDRPMRQSRTVLSAHAFGQAIDISGFRFADGMRAAVGDHSQPEVARRLLPLEALLKRYFDIVVDWQADPLRHETHFHCEVLGPRETNLHKPHITIAAGLVKRDGRAHVHSSALHGRAAILARGGGAL